MSSKKEVDGIILILSCQKHKDTRLKETNLKNTSYNNWEVVYVIGDLFLPTNYKYENINGKNYLYIKCEDSYLHLLKKLALSIKAVYELFHIKEGILRCGDDLFFNEVSLVSFLNSKKFDYYGQSACGKNYKCINKNELRKIKQDYFMINYYKNHKEDFSNPQHNLKDVNISLYSIRPDLYGAAGVLYFLSNKACTILISHMQKINFNILYYDQFTKSYPYTIEDCAVSFIMYFNDIEFIDSQNFIFKNNIIRPNMGGDDFLNSKTIVIHTNNYK